MTTTKNNQASWPPIVPVEFGSGKSGFQVVFQIKGKRVRKSFSTLKDAQKYAAEQRALYHREGLAAFVLTAADRAIAERCMAKLAPFKIGLDEAVDHYIETVAKFRESPTVSEIVEKIIGQAKADGRRDVTVIDLRHRLGYFANEFGDRRPGEIGLAELEQWANNPVLSPRSRRHNLTKASQLYRYAGKHGWCIENPIQNLTRPKVEQAEPHILTVEECARLLSLAEQFNLTAFVTLGIFAGIRPDELRKLEWSKIKLGEKLVRLDARVTKIGLRRIIELPDVAVTWLLPVPKKSGLIIGTKSSFKKRWKKLRRAAGYGVPGSETEKEKAAGVKLREWGNDSMRHTAASCWCAKTGDYAKTASMLGHSLDVLHRHYRGLVTPADAERFFNLRPDDEPGKIVPMQATVNA
ncbi:MAG: tyrosine-type recombinase/integrase [Verrucomicrobiota bacterium]